MLKNRVLQAHVSVARDVYSPCPALFTRMSMPPGSRRSTSLAKACSSVPEQLSVYCKPKRKVTGTEQASVLHRGVCQLNPATAGMDPD